MHDALNSSVDYWENLQNDPTRCHLLRLKCTTFDLIGHSEDSLIACNMPVASYTEVNTFGLNLGEREWLVVCTMLRTRRWPRQPDPSSSPSSCRLLVRPSGVSSLRCIHTRDVTITAPDCNGPVPDCSRRLSSYFWCPEVFSSRVAALSLKHWCPGFNCISRKTSNTPVLT